LEQSSRSSPSDLADARGSRDLISGARSEGVDGKGDSKLREGGSVHMKLFKDNSLQGQVSGPVPTNCWNYKLGNGK